MEECDDGDQNSDSGGCTLACKTNVCGDGHVKLGKEECDDGAANGDTAACTATTRHGETGGSFNLSSAASSRVSLLKPEFAPSSS